MATVVLRVEGAKVDLSACADWIPRDRFDNAHRVGDEMRGRPGRLRSTSGFTISLADADESGPAIEEAERTFEPLAPRIAELVAGGAEAEIDVGLMVGERAPKSLRLTPRFLGLLERAGVMLVVSAYPCSD